MHHKSDLNTLKGTFELKLVISAISVFQNSPSHTAPRHVSASFLLMTHDIHSFSSKLIQSYIEELLGRQNQL